MTRTMTRVAERRADTTAATDAIVGRSTAIAHLRDIVRRVGPSRVPVVIGGPSGAGKEMVARAIHAESDRIAKPFVAINCGAIPVELIESELFGHEKGSFTGAVARRIGRFEEAHGGTLFLDEIGDMRLDMQVKLLRVLEDGVVQRVGGGAPIAVDVRILCATHRNIAHEIEGGRFRKDLYFRLGVVTVDVPSLADRRDDIALLIEHFQSRMEAPGRARFGSDAIAALQLHDWPGNVRELRNVIERAHVLFGGETLTAGHVARLLGRAPVSNVVRFAARGGQHQLTAPPPPPARAPVDLKMLLETMELERIQMALDIADGVIAEAARLLTLKRTTLIEKMRKYRVGT